MKRRIANLFRRRPAAPQLNEVQELQAQVEALKARIQILDGVIDGWSSFWRSMVYTMFLRPGLSEKFRELINVHLHDIVKDIEAINSAQCTALVFPPTIAELPTILHLLESNAEAGSSLWDVSLTPGVIECEMSVEGKKIVKFTCTIAVTFAIRGTLKICVQSSKPNGPSDIGKVSISISFMQPPTVAVPLSSRIRIGKLPLPVEDEIRRVVERKLSHILLEKLVYPAEIVIPLGEFPPLPKAPTSSTIKDSQTDLIIHRVVRIVGAAPGKWPHKEICSALGVSQRSWTAVMNASESASKDHNKVSKNDKELFKSAAAAALVLGYLQLTRPSQNQDWSGFLEMASDMASQGGEERSALVVTAAKTTLIETKVVTV